MLHKSAKGRVINFDEMAHKNAKTIAVGNANLNARGDVLGRGGAVVQTVEERGMNNSTIVSTTKASIQSEISSLRAARSQWTETQNSNEDAAPAEAVPEPVQENDNAETITESAKKQRKITESE